MTAGSVRPGAPARPRPADAETLARQAAHRLAALGRECETAGIHRRCLVLRLSALPSDLRRPHHLRLAADALDPLLAADRAQRFVLPNHDIAVVWRGSAQVLLGAAHKAAQRMFADLEAEIPDFGQLWRLLDLPADLLALLDIVAGSLAPPEPPTPPAPPGDPLDAAALASLEMALAQADVARFARRRAVCHRAATGGFRLAWETRSLAADELCAELLPGRSARAEPWLFRRLARTLERRLLALLAATQELRAAGPFAIDVSVGNLLGPDFLRFDAALPHKLRGQVTLGLRPEDVLADLPAFLFARDFARLRGYRLLLHLPAGELLATLPSARLGFDLLRVEWSPAVLTLPLDLIEREAANLLLGGADGPEALAWGRANGVALFEGRAVQPGPAVVQPAGATG